MLVDALYPERTVCRMAHLGRTTVDRYHEQTGESRESWY